MSEPDKDQQPRATNRLGREKSPYLRQHRGNPVDWYPWGEEAFARARELDRPIFLSVGYATCHWCHVMERESFEDEAMAARINEVFVPVKVDREERPDVDDLYMTVCHLLTGHGGWPLTVLLTPAGRPFFAGTYFPKESAFGRVGLGELVDRVEALWRDRRLDALRSADQLVEAVAQEARAPSAEAAPLGEEVLRAAAADLAARFDEAHGGFGRAPKFPTPHTLVFLLRHGARQGDAEAVRMVDVTLRAMRAGGLFDQVGLGFHRYSTDARWLLPHFEKMLYDQALLALCYLEAAEVTGDPAHARVAGEIFEYVLRDLRGPHGAFLSAEDADSEGEEGRFYVWTAAELREALGPGLADLAMEAWGVTEEGNFAEEATRERTGANVLHQAVPAAELAERRGLEQAEVEERLEAARRALYARRGARPRPLCDDKVLVDLNGLMIAALARGARVLDRPDLAEAAERAVAFLWETLRRPEDREKAAPRGAARDATDAMADAGGGAPLPRLFHRFRDGEAAIPAFLDDYAFFVFGLLELCEATSDPTHLARARALQAALDRHHWDVEGGGYFLTADDGEALLLRRKTLYDGAIPSGNSVSALNLLRLGRLTGEARHGERAAALVRAFAGQARALPSAHCFLLLAVDYALASADADASARGPAEG